MSCGPFYQYGFTLKMSQMHKWVAEQYESYPHNNFLYQFRWIMKLHFIPDTSNGLF